MRLLCISNDFPLPTNNGGRVDVYRRLKQLADLGHEPALLTWYDAPRDGEPTGALKASLAAVCPRVMLFAITRGPGELVRRVLNLWRYPSHAASRWVTANYSQVLAQTREWKPALILLDGLYGAAVAIRLSTDLKLPLVYRSHNIEHRYMQLQMARASSWVRKLGLWSNLIGLRRLEESTIQRANAVLDISMADAAVWRLAGYMHVQWLPTLVDDAFAERLQSASAATPTVDLLYYGNLNTPNNVEAVSWLIQQVLPRLNAPGLRVVVAGSKPTAQVRQLIAGDQRIELVADPADMAAQIGRAKVLVNPVLAGSGVNLKSVEMLFSSAHLVSTPAGVAGLDDAAVACFDVRESPQQFAHAIERALAQQAVPPAQLLARAAARRPYTGSSMSGVWAGVLRELQGAHD